MGSCFSCYNCSDSFNGINQGASRSSRIFLELNIVKLARHVGKRTRKERAREKGEGFQIKRAWMWKGMKV